MANAQIEELDQYPIRITLTDADGDPVTPSTLRFRLDCETTQTQITDWADLAAASVVNLIIPSASNAIIDGANAFETKRVTVQANYGTPFQVSKRYLYDVLNNAAYA